MEMQYPHATILRLRGMHHEKLACHFGGRDIRLTDVRGEVAQENTGSTRRTLSGATQATSSRIG
jgi:hypothetical protein